ncbi:MAG: YchJ family metal-binding protein [Planctomycetota bacterium]|nr:YchJ family metal-binding protein [Planctomycetota bacterium]
MTLDLTPSTCPCGLPATLEACCGRYLHGFDHAPTPEALMRSRYCAFALGTPESVRYLVETHHKDFRPAGLEAGLSESMRETRWTSLKVQHARQDGDEGVVEFVAGCSHRGQVSEMRERSRFVREKGRWLYTTGS